MISKPIIKRINDTLEDIDTLESYFVNNETEKMQNVFLYSPTVYIHNWKSKDEYEIYVGETNDIIKRTKQHFDRALYPYNWQHKLKSNDALLYIIAHDHFNKSLTLDIENRLMHYLMSVDKVKSIHNLRDNPQKYYYPVNELDDIFTKIWKELRKYDKNLFPVESRIKESAIFKASPLHKLTKSQENAKNLIIDKVFEALENGDKGNIVFIDGEAGTGKTVLNSSTFYEIFCTAEENEMKIESRLLVNHDEQIAVYKQIAEKLMLTENYGEVVLKPTRFINNTPENEPVDVVFIDEAHLLLTQGKQSYQGKNQLEDIINRAKVTVVMFDSNQVLTTEQYWESKIINRFRAIAKEANSYIVLKEQLRMHCNKAVSEWIDNFTLKGIVKPLPDDCGDYEIKIFNNPETLHKAIKKKANEKDYQLSRLIASYDWDYKKNKTNPNIPNGLWSVGINGWHLPWNRELERNMSTKEKQGIRGLAWAEQPQTINEVGSTFTIQGFDLNYAGVILGPSVKYRNGRIEFDPTKSSNKKAIQKRSLSNGLKRSFGEELLKHELRVLMTRGVNGLYIYAYDEELRLMLESL